MVLVRLNPVLGYLRPALERILGEHVAGGWVSFVDERVEAGAHLVAHPGVDRVHMTGSAATYNALVWGCWSGRGSTAAVGSPC